VVKNVPFNSIIDIVTNNILGDDLAADFKLETGLFILRHASGIEGHECLLDVEEICTLAL
jgi:hypothetical protein